MARRKKLKTPKPRKIVHRVNAFQIHVKGPARNEAFKTIMDHVKGRLLKGAALVKQNAYGCVIRSMGGTEDLKLNALTLELIKYNSRSTGIAWDIKKNELITGVTSVTAQRTDMVIFIEKHHAVLLRKPHGPSPSELTYYLESLLAQAAKDLKLDCAIQVVPLRVGGSLAQIAQWKQIKRFSIEVYRPNPNPSIKTKQLRELLAKTNADKTKISVESQATEGIKYSGIKPLVDGASSLVERGQGHVTAAGINGSDEKIEVDSEKEKVKKIIIQTDTADTRTLAELFTEKLKAYLK